MCGILCKLDKEKAYDHVDWYFLLAIMQKKKKKDLGINELGGSSGVLPQQLSLCW